MEKISESMAWLARPDGNVVIGHGPFTATAEAPREMTAFYIRSFGPGTSQPWLIPTRTEQTTLAEFASRFEDRLPPHCEWHPLDAGPFSTVFQEVTAAIRSGLFEKTVPVVAETGFGPPDVGLSLVGAMTRQSSRLRSYGFFDGNRGFCGATPELLFSLSGSNLDTMALAGTAKREDREVFAVDEKEIREHEYVAQTLVSKLQALGDPIRRSREILDLGSIVHFLSLINVELEHQRTPADLIDLLHPTPALGPLPRTKETLSLLLGWRERLNCPDEFGAPFGVWENERFDAVVAIRGVWWDANQITLPAGCGVIEASRLVNEWRELRLKREAVKRLISP
jgi:menaquinone-specific isochorismate synthase